MIFVKLRRPPPSGAPPLFCKPHLLTPSVLPRVARFWGSCAALCLLAHLPSFLSHIFLRPLSYHVLAVFGKATPPSAFSRTSPLVNRIFLHPPSYHGFAVFGEAAPPSAFRLTSPLL